MQFNENTPRRTTQISGTSFEVIAPFAAGHVCTEGEAAALNQILAENLGNNFRQRVKDAQAGVEGVTLPTQEDLDAYIAAYEFGVRQSSGPRAPVDPIEKLAFEEAIKLVKAHVEKMGKKVKDFGMDLIKEKAVDLLADPEKGAKLRAKAAKIHKIQQQAAIDSLDMDFAA